MTKKEILVTLGIFLVVLVGTGAGLFVLTKRQSKAQANNATDTSVSSMPQTQPLDDTAQQNPSSDKITVVAGQNTTNLGQLGSGQVASKQNGVSPSSGNDSNTEKIAPGPEAFGQYDQYKTGQGGLFGDILIGTGNEAVPGKKVAVYYKGWLTNGQLFDQSKPGSDGKLQPFVFTLGAKQVIRGWEESIAGMKVGGKRRIIVPPAAGYGDTAQNGIPANSVLVFDVQLLAIQ